MYKVEEIKAGIDLNGYAKTDKKLWEVVEYFSKQHDGIINQLEILFGHVRDAFGEEEWIEKMLVEHMQKLDSEITALKQERGTERKNGGDCEEHPFRQKRKKIQQISESVKGLEQI